MTRRGDRGLGASRFSDFLLGLPDDIQRARDAGLPVVLWLDEEPDEHVRALMVTLGVPIAVVPR